MSKLFTVSISFDYDFSIDELWPNGDAPENPTVQDVVDLINKCGGVSKIICDWDIDRNLECIIKDDKELKCILPMKKN